MTPCISQVTSLQSPFEADVEAYAQAGWPAIELWLTKLERHLESHPLAEVKALLDAHGLRTAGASAQGGLLLSTGQERQSHWEHYRHRLEILAELGAKTLVIVPDFTREPGEGELAQAIASLSEAASLAGQHGVRLALEFPRTARFCASLDTALALVEQVESENLGVCLDLFHYYTGPSKFEDLAYLNPRNLAWVQLCDLTGTPRELAGDGDRILPGDGDFQLGPILDHLARIGYDGYVSVEVMNPNLWTIPVDRVAAIALQATRRTLGDRVAAPPMAGPSPSGGS